LAPDVVESALVTLEKWRELLQALGVEAINKAHVARAQQVFVDERAAVRCHCEVLPHVETFVHGVLLTHDHVLDANAELSLLVEARLITDAHSLDELEFVAAANTVRSLVHAQVRANTMACSVLVVEAGLPQILARQDVHVAASNRAVGGPDDALEVEGAEKHTRISLFLEGCGLAATEMSCASDIGSAVEVLTARVEQVDLAVVQR